MSLKENIQNIQIVSAPRFAVFSWTVKWFWRPPLWSAVKHVAIFCLSLTALWSVQSPHFSAGKSASLKPPSQTISAHYPPGRTTFYPIYRRHPLAYGLASASGATSWGQFFLPVPLRSDCVWTHVHLTSCLDLSNSEWFFYPPAASPPALSTQPITSPWDTCACDIPPFCLCLFKQHNDHNRLGVRERDQSGKWT